jgi:hypothetical protein
LHCCIIKICLGKIVVSCINWLIWFVIIVVLHHTMCCVFLSASLNCCFYISLIIYTILLTLWFSSDTERTSFYIHLIWLIWIWINTFFLLTLCHWSSCLLRNYLLCLFEWICLTTWSETVNLIIFSLNKISHSSFIFC